LYAGSFDDRLIASPVLSTWIVNLGTKSQQVIKLVQDACTQSMMATSAAQQST